VLSNLRGFRLGPDSLSWEFAGELVWAPQGWIYVTPRLLSFFWRGFLVILDLFQYFLYCYICSQGLATIWRGDVCGGDIGATQHVVWSWAPGQIFLRSGIWGLPVFQQRLYVDKNEGKTRGINSSLYEEYESVLFTIIVISYLVLFFWAILQYMLAYSLAILQEQLLGLFSAFLLFFHIASSGCTLPI